MAIRLADLTTVGVAMFRRLASSPGVSPSVSHKTSSSRFCPTRTPCRLIASSAAARASLDDRVNSARSSFMIRS